MASAGRRTWEIWFGLIAASIVWGGQPGVVRAQEASLHFRRLGQTEGLSQITVQALTQDSLGYLWTGTQDGLNRFDGYEFRAYRSVAGRLHGLTNDYVLALLTDSRGAMWVGTFEGLFSYDPRKDRFTLVRGSASGPAEARVPTRAILEDSRGGVWVGFDDGLVHLDVRGGDSTTFAPGGPGATEPNASLVTALAQDDRGVVWIGTRHGLRRLDPGTGAVTTLSGGADGSPEPPFGDVTALHVDSKGMLWIGTRGQGLVRHDPQRGTLTRFVRRPGGLSSDVVLSVHEDARGTLWVGTDDGLNSLDAETGRFSSHRHDDSAFSLSQNTVLSIFEDAGGLLWFGTLGGGLNVFAPSSVAFHHVRRIPDDPASLPHDMVYALLVDSRDALWVGTLEGGLSRYDLSPGGFTTFRHDPTDPRSLSSNYVVSVIEGAGDLLWVGTNGDGVNAFDRGTGKARRYRATPGKDDGLSSDRIRALARTTRGDIWIGTSGAGISRLDPSTGAFIHYRSRDDDPTTVSSDYIRCLYYDRRGRMWVGTYGNGLNLYDDDTDSFTRFVHEPGNALSLSSPYVRSVFEDRGGAIWVATDDGLNRLDEASGTFRAWHEEDGLPNSLVYGMREDDAGHLWLSTNGGLVRFTPAEDRFETFDENDGVQGREFNTGAFFQDPSGRMYFGGVGGLTVFDPDSVTLNTRVPPVVVTDFLLFNEPVVPGDSATLKEHVSLTRSLTLRPEDAVFAFQFAALDYRAPEKNRYRYRMEGLDPQWIQANHRNRRATFTHLSPGDYVFRVTASNDDGVWNEEGVSIAITVLPPFWRTLWFRGLVVLLVGGAVGGAAMWRMQDLRRRNARLEAVVQARTEQLRQRSAELQVHVAELEESLAHIQRLEGLLPICANCKNIKSSEGDSETWLPVEIYVMQRSDAVFTHGICPDCAKKLYPAT